MLAAAFDGQIACFLADGNFLQIEIIFPFWQIIAQMTAISQTAGNFFKKRQGSLAAHKGRICAIVEIAHPDN